MGQKISVALSSTVFEIQVFLCFANFAKIQNGSHFWREIFFLNNVLVTLQKYPADQKFRRNRSIAHGFRDTGILCFPYLENSQ